MTHEEMNLLDQMYGGPSETIWLATGDLLEPLRMGRLTRAELGVYTMLYIHADLRTGICTISIPQLMSCFAHDPNIALESVYRKANRMLQRLQENGLLAYTKVTRKPFPILLHKYLVRLGADRGQMLDAFAPGTLVNPVYVDEEGALSRTFGEPGLHHGVVRMS
jgi:hypothetical protein